jgi:Flp pilus assembly protein TadG
MSQANPTTSAVRCRRGSTLLYATVTLGVIAAFGSLMVDLGHVYLAKAELQSAANAAARAAADGTLDASARVRAVNAAADNVLEGQKIQLTEADVDIGFYSSTRRAFDTEAANFNAARVTLEGRSVPLLLGKLIGQDSVRVNATSIATGADLTWPTLLYGFNTNPPTVTDHSQFWPKVNLTSSDVSGTTLVGEGVWHVTKNVSIHSDGPVTRVIDGIKKTNEFTVFARTRNGDLLHHCPARIEMSAISHH